MHIKLPAYNRDKIFKNITVTSLWFLVLYGAIMVVLPIKPFWVDEWRLIYNIKFKDVHQLWGQLAYTQQCPRVYLVLLKWFCSLFNYSYFTLRFPAYLAGIGAIYMGYKIMKQLYNVDNGTKTTISNQFLFLLIVSSSHVFIFYYVQTKQYTMDVLLSLVAIYQLLALLKIGQAGNLNRSRYLLLCLSFLVCPFFSYTYTITLMPVYIIALIRGMALLKLQETKIKTLVISFIPLLIGVCSIVIFYITDVAQLMADKSMHNYWSYKMVGNGFNIVFIICRLWELFTAPGAGLLYEIIFGIVGIMAFWVACRQLGTKKNILQYTVREYAKIYSLILLIIVILLFLLGKIPIGEPRLTVYTLPSLAILIINLLDSHIENSKWAKALVFTSYLMYAGVIGHLYSSTFNTFTEQHYAKRINIYIQTEKAILLAKAQGMPIIVTPAVAFPDDVTKEIPYLEPILAYRVEDNIDVYLIKDIAELNDFIKKTPPEISKFLVGDGSSYEIVNKKQ